LDRDPKCDPADSRVSSEEADPSQAGALWYLETCGTALRMQQDRLLGISGPTDPTVDLWLTLVALRNALRAVQLAIRVAPDPQPLRAALASFESSGAATGIRNVFEHFDEYFLGEGHLQEGLEDPHSISPRITTTYDSDERSVTVRVGDRELTIPPDTKAADDLLWDVRKLLRQQVGMSPY
jgi:hypothetical protein